MADEGEAQVEAGSEAGSEVAVPDAPEVETPAAPAVDYAAEVEKWGGPEAVQKALDFQTYLNTQEGAADFFVDAGLALGIDPARLEALFQADAEEQARIQEEEAALNDEPLTRAQALALIKEQAVDPFTQAQQAAAQQQRVATIQTTVDGEAERLAIPANVLPIVLGFADQYLDQNTLFNPEAVKVAIGKGLEDWQKVIEQDHAAYLSKKKEAAEGAPSPLKGGSAGSEVQGEPQTVAEAKARVRAQMKASGLL